MQSVAQRTRSVAACESLRALLRIAHAQPHDLRDVCCGRSSSSTSPRPPDVGCEVYVPNIPGSHLPLQADCTDKGVAVDACLELLHSSDAFEERRTNDGCVCCTLETPRHHSAPNPPPQETDEVPDACFGQAVKSE
jgi:hypothetical protein